MGDRWLRRFQFPTRTNTIGRLMRLKNGHSRNWKRDDSQVKRASFSSEIHLFKIWPLRRGQPPLLVNIEIPDSATDESTLITE